LQTGVVTNKDWTKILGWPGYTVYQTKIQEEAKELRLWVRRKRGKQAILCSSCGRRFEEAADVSEREVRDLPCFQYRTTVVTDKDRISFWRIRMGGNGGMAGPQKVMRSLGELNR
jgi:hypothetical protein